MGKVDVDTNRSMGKLIRENRESLGWTQSDLGEMLDPPVKKAAVSKWERGEVNTIKRDHIQQLADFFEMAPSELMCLKDHIRRSDDVTTLIESYDSMDESRKTRLLNYAQMLTKQFKNSQPKQVEDAISFVDKKEGDDHEDA